MAINKICLAVFSFLSICSSTFGQNPGKNPLQLNIVDIQGNPTLAVNTEPKTLGIEFSKGDYKITTQDVPVLTFNEKLIDSKTLVYSIENPVLEETVQSFGYTNWKILKSDLDFKGHDKSKISFCGSLKIYGGHCKLSKVIIGQEGRIFLQSRPASPFQAENTGGLPLLRRVDWLHGVPQGQD